MFNETIVVLRWGWEGESPGNPGLFRLPVTFAYLPEKKAFGQEKGVGGEGDGVGASSSSTTVAVGVAEPANDQLDYDVSLQLLSTDGAGGDERRRRQKRGRLGRSEYMMR